MYDHDFKLWPWVAGFAVGMGALLLSVDPHAYSAGYIAVRNFLITLEYGGL